MRHGEGGGNERRQRRVWLRWPFKAHTILVKPQCASVSYEKWGMPLRPPARLLYPLSFAAPTLLAFGGKLICLPWPLAAPLFPSYPTCPHLGRELLRGDAAVVLAVHVTLLRGVSGGRQPGAQKSARAPVNM